MRASVCEKIVCVDVQSLRTLMRAAAVDGFSLALNFGHRWYTWPGHSHQ